MFIHEAEFKHGSHFVGLKWPLEEQQPLDFGVGCVLLKDLQQHLAHGGAGGPSVANG